MVSKSKYVLDFVIRLSLNQSYLHFCLQFLFVVGVIILVLGTYVTLNEADMKNRVVEAEKAIFKAPNPKVFVTPPNLDQVTIA